MKIEKTPLDGCFILSPDRFGDDRGYFSPFFIDKEIEKLGFEKIVQCNRSKSLKSVVRGLHFQKIPKAQAKIVEVLNGSAIDVVVDIRPNSPTYSQYFATLLSPELGKQLFIPRGFAHGFVSLEDDTVFQYLVDNDYAPELEDGILWNDPALNIPWLEFFEKYDIDSPILSEKDQNRHTLKEYEEKNK